MGIWNIFIYTYSLTIKFLQHSQDCNESFIKYKKLLNTYTGQLRHFRINSISEINISSLHKWKKCLKPILCTVWSGLHTRKYSISSMISCFHLAVRHFIIVVKRLRHFMIRWMIKICWSCSWITGGFFWDVFVIKFKTGKNIYPKKACFSPAMLWKNCTRFVAMEFILKCCVLLSLYGYYGKEHSFYSSPKFHFRMSCGWPFSQTVGTFKISNGFKFESCWLGHYWCQGKFEKCSS